MRSLVTGGTGFMGSAVVRALLADGQQVRVLARSQSNTRNLDGLDVEIVRGDITQQDSVERAMAGCDNVYHLAALVSFWEPRDRRADFYRVNVDGSRNVFKAALQSGVSKVVYTSTISTIGSYGMDNPTREDYAFNLWEMCSDYERSKYSAEFEAWKFAAKGLPVVAVLPAGPVGARDIKPNPIGKLILDFLARKLPGYMEGGGNFVDVDDVAYGHLLAAKHGKIGERYILAGANLTTLELFKALEAVSGVRAPRYKIPYAAALTTAHALEFMADHITRKPPLLTVPLVKFSSKHYYVDGSKAQSDIGFSPRVTPVNALIKAIDWFLLNGYVRPGTPESKSIRRHLDQFVSAHAASA